MVDKFYILYDKMTPQEVKIISLGMEIKKWNNNYDSAESEGARMLADMQISNLEHKYFDLWYESNRDSLQEEYTVCRLER